MLSSSKVYPSQNGLDADEANQIAKLGAIIAPAYNQKPNFKKIGSKIGRGSFATSGSIKPYGNNISSFLSTNSEMEDGVSLEAVINFLTANIDNMFNDRVYMKEFEEMCHEMMRNSRDPELHRILKSHGWNGARFKESTELPLDLNLFLQDISNLYLHYKVSVYSTNISSLYESGNERATNQIYSFVPDTLLAYLNQNNDIILSNTTTNTKSPRNTITPIGRNNSNNLISPRLSAGIRRGNSPKSTPRTSISPKANSNDTTTPAPVPGSSTTTANTTTAVATSSTEVRSFTFTGACMLADISGFSKFSGEKCSKGVSGLDELREATNGFLGHIVETVYEFNGDVVAFAGDALICVFIDHEESSSSSSATGESSSDGTESSSKKSTSSTKNKKEKSNKEINCCYRALQCANILKNHKTRDLSAHIGVSYGIMKLALLGGLNEQYIYLLNGSCVSELSLCIENAKSQEIAITKACYTKAMEFIPPEDDQNEDLNTPNYKLLTAGMKKMNVNVKIDLNLLQKQQQQNQCDDQSVQSFEDDKPRICIHTIPNVVNIYIVDYIDPRVYYTEPNLTMTFRRNNSKIPNLKSPNNNNKSIRQLEKNTNNTTSSSSGINNGSNNNIINEENEKLNKNAVCFIPRPILSAIYSETLEHIGELRLVTTMFISLDTYSTEKNNDPCTLQPFFLMAQQILQESGGYLRQFLIDDKGCVFIAMWGMPSFTYSNNAARALYCSVAISNSVKKLDHICSIGISTGNVFCGTVGSIERRDYAGIGTDVNMAARLMSKAKSRILLDMKTYHNLNEKTRKLLIPAEEMKLKGSELPITPFQYIGEDFIPSMESSDDYHQHAILRRQVKTILNIQIDKISNNGLSSLSSSEMSQKLYTYYTVVIGPPGTGKSTAVEYFRHSARKRNIPCFFIKARPGHEGVPYGLMRELFLELIGEHNFITEQQQRNVLMILIEQAYYNKTIEEKKNAMFSLEIVMGVEWGKSSRKVGSFKNVVIDAINTSKKKEFFDDINELIENNEENMVNNTNNTTTNNNTIPEDDHISSLPNDKHGEVTSSPYENMLYDSSMTHLRPVSDLAFYNILSVLLKNRRVAIIIEDAHFCDELSWTELNLILNGNQLGLTVLITMRSNTIMKNAQQQHHPTNTSTSNTANSFTGSVLGSFAENNATATTTGASTTSHVAGGYNSQLINNSSANRQGNRKNSLLSSAISNSISVSRSISIDSVNVSNVNTPKGGASATTTAGSAAGSCANSPISSPQHFSSNANLRTSSSEAIGISNNNSSATSSATSSTTAENVNRYGLTTQTSTSLLSILSHERATVIEMTGLTQSEVKEVLLHTLKVDHISQNLIKLVYDVSSGNAYWCKAIANFIKERGIKELEETIHKNENNNSNTTAAPYHALKILILMRMEKLDIDNQMILKIASIIGDEFSESMLKNVLPNRIQEKNLIENLDILSENGFIYCVEEFPENIFAFQNELIRETLYELMPPKDAALIHLGIAQFIEAEYSGNLRPFYPMLGSHYSRCMGYRSLAFKYLLKAADQAISRGAFSDGLGFVEDAFRFAFIKPELTVLSDVINRALHDIEPIKNSKISKNNFTKIINKHSFGISVDTSNTSTNIPNTTLQTKIQAYTDILNKVQIKLNNFAKNAPAKLLSTTTSSSGQKGGPTEARLNWQPSYVASRMNDNNSEDSDGDEPRSWKRKTTKKIINNYSYCSIS